MSPCIPWPARKIGEVVQPVDKVDPARRGPGQFRYVDIGSIDGARHLITNAVLVDNSSAPSRARQVLRAEDTLFSTVRPYLEKIALVDQRLDGEIASTGFTVLRPDRSALDPRFLFHFTTSKQLLDQVLPLQRGVSYPAVRDRDVLAATIPLPGVDEQRRIVDILEDHLSRLDAADALMRGTPNRLSAMRGQVLRTAPELLGAKARPLAELLSGPLANGRSVPTADQGFPVLRLTALREGHVDLSERKLGGWTAAEAAAFLVARGDFLVSRGNGSLHLVGRGAPVNVSPDAVAFPDTMIRFRLSPEVDLRYFDLIWNSYPVRQQLERLARTTAGIYKVNQGQLLSIRVPVPSRDLQIALAGRLGGLDSAVTRTAAALGMVGARQSRLRASLLAAAFSGRLTGKSSDLDRAAEIASV